MTKISRLMLAVVAVCGTSAAMAQSSVNLYGRINTTLEQQKWGSNKVTGMVSNSSYLGFRGVEDLGGGLKAGFILEGRFESDTGGNNFNFQRQSEVNLGGNFGTLRLGNFDSAALYAVSDPVSMHNHDTGSSADAFAAGYVNGGNKVAYVTPNFGGLTAEIQYQFGEKQSDGFYEQDGGWDAALNYGNGPLALGLGYSQAKWDNLVGGDDYKERQFGGYAAYSFGDFTLAGYYQRQKFGDDSRNVYRLAGKYAFGASELHANVGRAAKTDNFRSATQWTVAYNYNLSKRTKVYAFYTSLNHTTSADVAPGSTFSSLAMPAPDNDKFRSIAVGVRHLF